MFTQNLGHLRFIFGTIFIAAVITQIRANKFNAYLYWITIIATTSLGTTLADFADRSLGIGYLGCTLLLSTLFISSLIVWHQTMGSISVEAINSHKAEMFYWVAIMFSQTMGTALWTSPVPLPTSTQLLANNI